MELRPGRPLPSMTVVRPNSISATVRLGAVAALAISLIAGCGRIPESHAVLLWSADEQVHPTGVVLPVFEESRIKKTSVVPGPAGEVEVETWRLASFKRRAEAEAFAKSFAPMRAEFARSNRNALPVREKPDRLSNRVYRLREGEIVKILERSATPSDENGLQGYWLKVLTEGGVIGYCFDLHLIMIDPATGAPKTVAETAGDELTRLLSSNWRPTYFQEMINEERVDLALFKPDFGFFVDASGNKLRFALPGPGKTMEWSFTGITQVRPRVYIAEGTPVRMELRARDLYVEYTKGNTVFGGSFIPLEGEVEDHIKLEEERRAAVLADFVARGPRYSSSSYGTIELSASGGFRWQGTDRLPPSVFPAGGTVTGTLEFSLFPATDLRAKYDGGLQFRPPDGKPAAFFYTLTASGFRLVYVRPEDVYHAIIEREPRNPLVLVFSRD